MQVFYFRYIHQLLNFLLRSKTIQSDWVFVVLMCLINAWNYTSLASSCFSLSNAEFLDKQSFVVLKFCEERFSDCSALSINRKLVLLYKVHYPNKILKYFGDEQLQWILNPLNILKFLLKTLGYSQDFSTW